VVLGRFTQYLWQYVWPQIPLIYGQAPEIYLKGFFAFFAAILWLIYRGHRTRSRLLLWFFGVLAVSWVAFLVLAVVHHDGITYDVAIYVPVLVALAFKTPTAAEVLMSLRFLGWMVAVILVGTRAAELVGLIPMVDVGPYLLHFEVTNYWLPHSGSIGPEGRWPGPMGHNAMTGNAAAMLVVLAAGIRTRDRWLFGFVGVVVLLITASRGSQMGAIVGVVVIVLLGNNPLTRRVGRKTLASVLAVAGVLGIGYLLVKNPNLTGRTTYWQLAFDLWRQHPVTGAGASGIADSPLYIAGKNAHNLVIDGTVKYGVVGAALVLTILTMAGVLTTRAGLKRLPLPTGIFAAYLVIGLVEADQGWLGISLPWVWLVLAVLLAGRLTEQAGVTQSPDRGREPLAGSACAEAQETLAGEA
jgi:O-antigen ligase